MDLKRFLEKLASCAPTPGGGSASALSGALSAALVAMTAGLSLKKGKLKREEAEKTRKDALAVQRKLLRAVTEDAKSYEAVLKAFRLPKDSEKQRLFRTKAIKKAYQKATLTPELVSQLSLKLMTYSKILISKGNPVAVSDAGVAAFLADAALAGGLLNIGVNLVSVTDKTFLNKMNLLMKQLARKRNRLMKDILNRLIGIKQS